MTSSQGIKKIIKLSSNTATCTYKHIEGDIWPTIPQKTKSFTTSNEFKKIDLNIFNYLFDTNTAPATKPENEGDIIEDDYSDFDDTDADPDYHPKGPKDLLPTEDEQLENDVIVMADCNPSNNNETELSNYKCIGNYLNFLCYYLFS